MEIIRKTNVLIKTERKIVIRQSSADQDIWCEECTAQMVTAQAAAFLHNLSTREIYRFVEQGKLHFFETADRVLFVCPQLTEPVLPAI